MRDYCVIADRSLTLASTSVLHYYSINLKDRRQFQALECYQRIEYKVYIFILIIPCLEKYFKK